MAAALDHVTLTATDFAASAAFYDAALGAIGYQRVAELVDEEEDGAEVEAAAWGSAAVGAAEQSPAAAAVLWLVRGATPTSGLHLRLRVASRGQVETFFARAITAGGAPQSAPRRWTPYRRGDFAATVRDPAGNLVEVVGPE